MKIKYYTCPWNTDNYNLIVKYREMTKNTIIMPYKQRAGGSNPSAPTPEIGHY